MNKDIITDRDKVGVQKGREDARMRLKFYFGNH